MSDPRFAPDLYRGSASFYDQYRIPYPATLIDDLVRRTGPSGCGRLLDLACGTGQLTFPLRRWFRDVWAVDQEADMIKAVRSAVAAANAVEVRPIVSSAETLHAETGSVELAVIGNAFHRLDRDLVAGRLLGWLRPGGHVALCWSSSPWAGEASWQRALSATVERWTAALGAAERVPSGWNRTRQRRPDLHILSEAGFETRGRSTFSLEHQWTLPDLAGYLRSTSFLPATVLGDQAAAFDADLEASLRSHSPDNTFVETISFAYDLARKPS